MPRPPGPTDWAHVLAASGTAEATIKGMPLTWQPSHFTDGELSRAINWATAENATVELAVLRAERETRKRMRQIKVAEQ
jgi:hypothetical protein